MYGEEELVVIINWEECPCERNCHGHNIEANDKRLWCILDDKTNQLHLYRKHYGTSEGDQKLGSFSSIGEVNEYIESHFVVL